MEIYGTAEISDLSIVFKSCPRTGIPEVSVKKVKGFQSKHRLYSNVSLMGTGHIVRCTFDMFFHLKTFLTTLFAHLRVEISHPCEIIRSNS